MWGSVGQNFRSGTEDLSAKTARCILDQIRAKKEAKMCPPEKEDFSEITVADMVGQVGGQTGGDTQMRERYNEGSSKTAPRQECAWDSVSLVSAQLGNSQRRTDSTNNTPLLTT